jgi:hypothetical protein
LGIGVNAGDNPLIGTIFTYERGFDALISGLAGLGRGALLLVFGDQSHAGMAATLVRLNGGGRQHQSAVYKNINIVYMPFISQHDYDTLLCCADFNIVRGEDSLARAVLSGKPFVWNAYVQDEKYQLVKVEALLETMRPYYESLFGDGGGGHPANSSHSSAFAAYRALMLGFNDSPAPDGPPGEATRERYGDFFKNLKKHERAASAMYYFMVRNCDLIAKFSDFLDNYNAPP